MILMSLVGWHLGADKDLATKVKVGDRVRHHNTRQWARVLSIVPQRDGTAELEIEREETPGAWNTVGTGYWATYHIDKHEPCASQAPTVEMPATGPTGETITDDEIKTLRDAPGSSELVLDGMDVFEVCCVALGSFGGIPIQDHVKARARKRCADLIHQRNGAAS